MPRAWLFERERDGDMSDNRQLQESMKRALTALRDHQVGKALEDMRKDIAGPQERVIAFVCACSGAPFHVRFTRANPVERFTIAAIERDGQRRQEPPRSSVWNANAGAFRKLRRSRVRHVRLGVSVVPGKQNNPPLFVRALRRLRGPRLRGQVVGAAKRQRLVRLSRPLRSGKCDSPQPRARARA